MDADSLAARGIVVLKGTNVRIDAGKKFSLPVIIKAPNSSLKWQFSIDGGLDIGFDVQHNQEDTDGSIRQISLVKYSRQTTEADAARGKIKIRTQGACVLVWDNSYSWMRSKVVNYMIKVVDPSSQTSGMRFIILGTSYSCHFCISSHPSQPFDCDSDYRTNESQPCCKCTLSP